MGRGVLVPKGFGSLHFTGESAGRASAFAEAIRAARLRREEFYRIAEWVFDWSGRGRFPPVQFLAAFAWLGTAPAKRSSRAARMVFTTSSRFSAVFSGGFADRRRSS